MIRDPFYREIVDRLNGPLDRELFERCAADLLRAIYPTLVPIRGGSDLGMDGAIADSKGPPIPLVSTTSDRVPRNLRENLRSYLESGGKSRKVVVATSCIRNSKCRRNLESIADELGFALLQTHDQTSFADLLYPRPEWCLELLGLTGDPPPLSAVPVTDRPLIVQSLIGRDGDLAWLEETEGDLLLAGQPGSGKTSIFHQLAKQGYGLFAASADSQLIANAIRKQSPTAILVDDAHLDCDFLRRLRHLRSDIGASFCIIANCWPGARDEVALALGIANASIRELRLLKQDEMLNVVKNMGVAGPGILVQELINQSAGRPGLAVTLCTICVRDGVKAIALGDALERDIRTAIEPLVGQNATAILAAFAIGGNQGMRMDVVANCLAMPSIELRQAVSKLAAGGVLWEVNNTSLAVRPPTLRYALVRDVFFGGADRLKPDQLIANSLNPSDVALTLIGAKARRADVPMDLITRILELVQKAYWSSPRRCDEAWEAFVELGATEADWVLERHPEKLIVVARAALDTVPESVIPMLLQAAIGDDRKLHVNPDHPLRLLKSWVEAAEPRSQEALTRRATLLDSTFNWLAADGDLDISLRAISEAMSPRFVRVDPMPGGGGQFAMRSACVSPTVLSGIQRFWPRILASLRQREIVDWTPIQRAINNWAYPGNVGAPTKEIGSAMQAFARKALRDIAQLVSDRPGVLHWVKETARVVRARFKVALDDEFETLFPIEGRGAARRSDGERQFAAVKQLGKAWSQQPAANIVSRILRFEEEARRADFHGPKWTPALCREIAILANDPLPWIQALLDADGPSEFIGPFLWKAEQLKVSELPTMLSCCIQREKQRTAALDVVFTMTDPRPDVLQLATAQLPKETQWLTLRIYTNEFAEDYVLMMLRHENRDVRAGAARGTWESEPKGKIAESLNGAWRAAVVECVEDEYWLPNAFQVDQRLAFDWLTQRIKENSRILRHVSDVSHVVEAALKSLMPYERREILSHVSDDYCYVDLLDAIIGSDNGLYSQFLAFDQLRNLHLSLLAGHPKRTRCDNPINGSWLERATLTLNAGYSADEVARATIGYGWSWSGNESEMWAAWQERFRPFLSYTDHRIQMVAGKVLEHVGTRRESALKDEFDDAVHGRVV